MLITLVSASCIATTRHGINVNFGNNPNQISDIELATESLVDALVIVHPNIYTRENVYKTLSDSGITVTVRNAKVLTSQGLCEGVSWNNYLEYKHHDCIVESAFQHELMHVIMYLIEKRVDADHSDLSFWDTWNKNSVYSRAYLSLQNKVDCK